MRKSIVIIMGLLCGSVALGDEGYNNNFTAPNSSCKAWDFPGGTGYLQIQDAHFSCPYQTCGSCQRLTNTRFQSITMTSPTLPAGTTAANTFYALNTGRFFAMPNFLSGTYGYTHLAFSVALDPVPCTNKATTNLNFVQLQIAPGDLATVGPNFAAGTSTVSYNSGTSQYVMTMTKTFNESGATTWSGSKTMPLGTGVCSNNTFTATGGVGDAVANVVFANDFSGYWKGSLGRTTGFFPANAIDQNALKNINFSVSLLINSGTGNTAREALVTSGPTGLVFTVIPYAANGFPVSGDPAAATVVAGKTQWDTITIASSADLNNPAPGFFKATLTRQGQVGSTPVLGLMNFPGGYDGYMLYIFGEDIWVKDGQGRNTPYVLVMNYKVSAGAGDIAWATADTTYMAAPNTTGKTMLTSAIGNSRFTAVAVDSNGNTVAVGQNFVAANRTQMLVARYKPDGTLDTSFNSGGTTPGTYTQNLYPGKIVTVTPETASAANGMTFSKAGPTVITWTAGNHGFSVGDAIVFSAVGAVAGTAPIPAINTVYYIGNIPALNTMKLTTTQGGATYLNNNTGTANTPGTGKRIGRINLTAHGFSAGDPVVFSTTGTMPTGLTAGTTYYVASTVTKAANWFYVSATPGGAYISPTSAGTGTLFVTSTNWASTATSVANAVALDSSNNVYVAGSASNGSTKSFAVMKLTSAGVLDTTWNTTGYTTTQIDTSGQSSVAYAIALQSDGKVVVAGNGATSTGNMAVARYTTGGVLDSAGFNSGGSLAGTYTNDISSTLAAFGSEARAVAIDPVTSKIVVAGWSTESSLGSPTNAFGAMRLKTDGTLDSGVGGFNVSAADASVQGPAGTATVQMSNQSDSPPGGIQMAYYVLINGSSQIYLVGTAIDATGHVGAVLKLTSAGIRDLTFNTTGMVLQQFSGNASPMSEIRAASFDYWTGSLVLAGIFNGSSAGGNPLFTARMSTSGVFDTTYAIANDATNKTKYAKVTQFATGALTASEGAGVATDSLGRIYLVGDGITTAGTSSQCWDANGTTVHCYGAVARISP